MTPIEAARFTGGPGYASIDPVGPHWPAGGTVEETLHITFIWLHILGITLWVGPQFFLAAAWVPASRQITDMPTRLAAMRTITRRFGYLGGGGLVLTMIAGLYLVTSWRDFYAVPGDVGFTELRYGVVFIIKMMVLAVMLAVSALHMFVLGPRQLDRLEAQARGENVTEEELRSVRKQSMFLSISGLVLTLAIMVMGVTLNTASWSLQE
ncbi:MAG: hypothetical protein IH609_07505, partial [Dehalococcoidia bacterium]|nr:hypothetical protein [Dehalococcoidia bacterium]